MYLDESEDPRQVVLLDCSQIPPTPVIREIFIQKEMSSTVAICCVEQGTTQLLITASATSVSAYDILSGKAVWRVLGRRENMEKSIVPKGVTTDGSRYIFVVDENNSCVHKLSLEGKYIDTLLRKGRGLYKRTNATWCAQTSTLVVSVVKESK